MVKVATLAAVVLCMSAGAQAPHHGAQQASRIEPKLSLGQPSQIGTIALVPIESTLPLSREEYLTLAEATKLGVVEIVEIPGQEQVNSLEVRNKSKYPILLFAGELLLGGKQDRIVAKDSIVPAMERRDVPVFCVEHGRWNGRPDFKAGNTFVPNQVRAQALAQKGQYAVWDNVAGTNRIVGGAPSTGTIRGTLDQPKIKAEAEHLLSEMNNAFHSNSKTVGVMCWINGKIQSADIFANHTLFNASKEMLFRSYAVDVQLESNPKATPVDLAKCKAFLHEILIAQRTTDERNPYGNVYLLKNGKVIGLESGQAPLMQGGAMGGSLGHGSYAPGGGGK